MRVKYLIAALMLALSAPIASAQTPAPPLLDGAAIAGPPPAANTAAQARDTLAMRPQVSVERLARARADQAYSSWVEMQPVLGDNFTEANFPRTARVFAAMLAAVPPVTNAAKAAYTRTRPYVVDANVLQCDPPGDSGGVSPSYPSGHGAMGWATALLLAELVPSRADAILVRGRDFGESRIICGFHYPSDIEASRLLASATIARLHADASFRRDLDAARRELARAYPN